VQPDVREVARHPVHRAFVARRWVPEVDDFLELDYQPLG
jgi:hypothetical protein